MRVLVACERSGIVRDAFLARGHDAWSCDIYPSKGSNHLQQDVTPLLKDSSWDLVIAHPPCTHLCNSGVRWFKERPIEKRMAMIDGYHFFLDCLNARASKVCVENPIMHCYAKEKIQVKPSQIIQPWMFGHPETKATCLWLKGLPLLTPTNVVSGRNHSCHTMQIKYRAILRSITFKGIAEAMADQWGDK